MYISEFFMHKSSTYMLRYVYQMCLVSAFNVRVSNALLSPEISLRFLIIFFTSKYVHPTSLSSTNAATHNLTERTGFLRSALWMALWKRTKLMQEL